MQPTYGYKFCKSTPRQLSGVILDRVSFHGRFVHIHLPSFLYISTWWYFLNNQQDWRNYDDYFRFSARALMHPNKQSANTLIPWCSDNRTVHGNLIGGSWNKVLVPYHFESGAAAKQHFFNSTKTLFQLPPIRLLYMPSYVMMSTTAQLCYYAPLLIIRWPIASMRCLLLFGRFDCAICSSWCKMSCDYA